METNIRQAPFWPNWVDHTDWGWPKFLALKSVWPVEIDKYGVHFDVTMKDFSTHHIVFSPDLPKPGPVDPRDDGSAHWYARMRRLNRLPVGERAAVVKRLRSTTKGYLSWSYGPMRCPKALIFDMVFFQAHGPRYFVIDRETEILSLRPDAPIVPKRREDTVALPEGQSRPKPNPPTRHDPR